jgi:hypothetical protein
MLECRAWRIGPELPSSAPPPLPYSISATNRWYIWDAQEQSLRGSVTEQLGVVAHGLRRWLGLHRCPATWHFCETPDDSLVFTLSLAWGWRHGTVRDALHRPIGRISLRRPPSIWLTFPHSQPAPWIIHNTPSGWEIEIVWPQEPLRKLTVTGRSGGDNLSPGDCVTVRIPAELDDEPFIKMLLMATAVLQLHNNIFRNACRTLSGVPSC